MRRAPWGILAASLAAALAVLALVAGATGLQGDAERALPATSGPGGERALDGEWVVRGDRTGRGARLGWADGSFAGRTVRVPFSPNARHVRGVAGERSFAGSVAWYRTTVTVARAGDYAIRFESVNHRATVWVDGRRVARHTGTYLPFEARVRLAAGAHALVVRADWRNPVAMKADAWHRTWFNFGGINRPVSIRPLGASELDAPSIVTRLDGTAAAVDVTVRVTNRAGARAIGVRGTVGGATLRFPVVYLARGAHATVRATARIADPDLWQPGHPTLHALRLEVPGESAFAARVGLRELRWAGGRLDLNGEPLKLRGASLQEDAPGRGDALTDADMDAIVARLKAIGANATRSQHPLTPALLDRLDAAGILVWQGVGPVDAPGAWTSRTAGQRRRAVRRVRLNVLQARLHPSVVAWNLANEVAGNGHFGGQPEYVDAAAQLVHRLDPGRPAAVDVWGTHLPAVAGPMYRHVDAIGATNYEGWYADTLAPPATVQAGIAAWLSELRRAFPGKVLVVSEFGAEANRLNAPGTPGSEQFQARLLTQHIRSYEAASWLDGELVWNLQDFALAPSFAGGSIRGQVPAIRLVRGINQKGLFTYAGEPKPAVVAVRRAFAAGA
jgi:Glycosyl hydrolases family 2, TIM barrel domain/Glycosyl hydrolases family 2, sugar binding domain